MTFATMINVVLILLCVSVLVQSARMGRRMKQLRDTQISESVTQIDRATSQARVVLGDLKRVLSTDGAAQASAIAAAEEIRDELTLMVGIGNAVADRIMDAAAQTPKAEEAAPKKRAVRKPRAAKPKTAAKTAPKAAAAKSSDAEKVVAGILEAEKVVAPARTRSRRKVAVPAAINDVTRGDTTGVVRDIAAARASRESAVA
jgi:DNA gyrase/topoisomerase IV subunit B